MVNQAPRVSRESSAPGMALCDARGLEDRSVAEGETLSSVWWLLQARHGPKGSIYSLFPPHNFVEAGTCLVDEGTAPREVEWVPRGHAVVRAVAEPGRLGLGLGLGLGPDPSGRDEVEVCPLEKVAGPLPVVSAPRHPLGDSVPHSGILFPTCRGPGKSDSQGFDICPTSGPLLAAQSCVGTYVSQAWIWHMAGEAEGVTAPCSLTLAPVL